MVDISKCNTFLNFKIRKSVKRQYEKMYKNGKYFSVNYVSCYFSFIFEYHNNVKSGPDAESSFGEGRCIVAYNRHTIYCSVKPVNA